MKGNLDCIAAHIGIQNVVQNGVANNINEASDPGESNGEASFAH
jgi:hypothetical protein